MSLAIEPLRDAAEWDRYVTGHERGTLYHLTAWKNAIEKTFDRESSYFVGRENGTIRGILPIFILPTLFSGRKAVSIPFAMYGGILADTEAFERELLDVALRHSWACKAGHLEMRCQDARTYEVPENDLYVTYIRELADTEEKLLAAIPKKSRYSVRWGYSRFGLVARFDPDLDTLYRLYAINKRELGSPVYPKTFFLHLVEEFKGKTVICTVDYQGQPVASVLSFVFRDTMYPYFSGCDSRYNFTGSNNVLYFELMKYAIQNMIQNFDFGRSRKETRAGDFKRHMGFSPSPLHYYYFLQSGKKIPNVSPSNSHFKPLTAIWQNLPLRFVNWLGPKLVRYIP